MLTSCKLNSVHVDAGWRALVRVQRGSDLLLVESRVRAPRSTKVKCPIVHQGEQPVIRDTRRQVVQLRRADGGDVRPGPERHVGPPGQAVLARAEDAELHVQGEQPVGTHVPMQRYGNVSQRVSADGCGIIAGRGLPGTCHRLRTVEVSEMTCIYFHYYAGTRDRKIGSLEFLRHDLTSQKFRNVCRQRKKGIKRNKLQFNIFSFY